MSSQASPQMKELMKKRLTQLPGPKGTPDNEAYMVELINTCDAAAMFDENGAIIYAWSQDGLNAWYWHVDVEPADVMTSKMSYSFKQGDDSSLKISSETAHVAKFMKNRESTLFFNGAKFHTNQRGKEADGIDYAVMGGKDGRGLHCAISPAGDCMVIVCGAQNAWPAEKYMGIDTKRPDGKIKTDVRTLGGPFRKAAAGALGC